MPARAAVLAGHDPVLRAQLLRVGADELVAQQPTHQELPDRAASAHARTVPARGGRGLAARRAADYAHAVSAPCSLPSPVPAAGVLVALALALTPSLASAQEPLALAATTAERGWIAFALQAPAGMPVTISETAGAASEPVAAVTGAGETTLERASSWRCDRRVRRFVATAADGRTATAEARTPTCRDRLAPTVPRACAPRGA